MNMAITRITTFAKENKDIILWRFVFGLSFIHVSGVYGLYLGITQARIYTTIFVLLYGLLALLGTSAGAHRLFSHKSYTANKKLRTLLMLMCTTVYEQNLYTWVRNHRTHHKFSETEADPHNPTRGLFYSHIGWLMFMKGDEVKEKGKQVDMSDIESDPVLIFHRRYYPILMPLLAFILPGFIPWYFWSEDLRVCFYYVDMFRMAYVINAIFSINSLAHHYGYKPYDKRIGPTDNRTVNILTCGDGNHNYHHVFPWDYRSSEFEYFTFGTAFIEYFAKIGWATDLRFPSNDIISKRSTRTGDGSRDI